MSSRNCLRDVKFVLFAIFPFFTLKINVFSLVHKIRIFLIKNSNFSLQIHSFVFRRKP